MKALEVAEKNIRQICENTAKALGCTADVKLNRQYPAVINPPKETDNVIKLAKKWFGEEHFSEEDMPLTASEDFSYFL